jgi:trehalose 6-phosphate phosphatase
LKPQIPERIQSLLNQHDQINLFLDYDGTLDKFAPTPNHILPNPEIIDLLKTLSSDDRFQVTILSGRKLDSILQLVPLDNIIRAGTYGIEIQPIQGQRFSRFDITEYRPYLEQLDNEWSKLIGSTPNIYMENKSWSLALHTRFADQTTARKILTDAKSTAMAILPEDLFHLHHHQTFLEAAPNQASKRLSLEYLLETFPVPNGLLMYIGDDEKDEEAMALLKEKGGISIRVLAEPTPTQADWILPNPQAVFSFLKDIPFILKYKEHEIKNPPQQ